jgi:thiamine-phosphate pyrophosphorylase
MTRPPDARPGDAPRLYLITPPAFEPAAFAPLLAAALDAGGVACVRLDLVGDEAAIRRAAGALRPVCVARDVALVIADHLRLVGPLGLDGVHLADGSAAAVRRAREALGPEAIVGAAAGLSKHRGMVAAEAGADYVSLGPVAPDAGAAADADLFAWWSEMIETPSVAEGGLTLDAARALAPLADFLAPREAVWDAPEGPAAAVRAFVDALRRGT